MLMSIARHRETVNELQAQLADRERHISELEARVECAEKTAHSFVEETRYALESAAEAMAKNDRETGATLASIAHVLPYVLSGRRRWGDPSPPEAAADAKEMAKATTRAYGFELPSDAAEGVKSLLELSSMLFVPSHSLPVERLRIRYPVADAA